MPAAAAQHLVGRERRPHRQQAEAGDRAAARLDVVVDALAEQLVAAADAEDRAAGGGPAPRARRRGRRPRRRSRSSTVAFVPGTHHEVGALDVGGRAREAHAHAGLGRQRVDVGEVAHPAQADDGDVERVAGRRAPRRDGPRARASPRRRSTGPRRTGRTPSVGRPVQLLELLEARARGCASSPRNLLITKPATWRLVGGVEQRERPEQRREHAAAVDVGDDDHREVRPRGPATCSSGRRRAG